VTVFSFPYREERSRAGRPIFRPSVTVELQDADGRWHPFRHFTVCYEDARRMTDFILREEREA
jgi:hypothetical protein